MTVMPKRNIEKLINHSKHIIEKPPFTQIYNFVINHLIDSDAFAIWVYLQSKSEQWIPREKEIHNHFINLGRDRIHRALMTLKACGLYVVAVHRNEQTGRFGSWSVQVKCGIGCEEKILAWKESRINTGQEKNKLKNGIQSEYKDCTEQDPNQNTPETDQNEVHADIIIEQNDSENNQNALCYQNTGFPETGDSVYIHNKELLRNKEKQNNITKQQHNLIDKTEETKLSSSFVFDLLKEKELLNCKNRYMKDDLRADVDFTRQCRFHFQKRIADGIEPLKAFLGLKKLIVEGRFSCPSDFVNVDDQNYYKSQMKKHEEIKLDSKESSNSAIEAIQEVAVKRSSHIPGIGSMKHLERLLVTKFARAKKLNPNVTLDECLDSCQLRLMEPYRELIEQLKDLKNYE